MAVPRTTPARGSRHGHDDRHLRWHGGPDRHMNNLTQLLDPKRSLAAAVGWLTALLSLAIAVAMVWVSNVERDQLLADRDAALASAAEALAAEVDTAIAQRLRALDVRPTSNAPSALSVLRPELAAIVDQARNRLKLDARMRALLL
ncbi:MAG TPA: hypothetical protein VGP22_07595, partial [Albitalea sp.]|nr:hypothetical protein [Albitalea sp.]